jgi:hypothetical protein
MAGIITQMAGSAVNSLKYATSPRNTASAAMAYPPHRRIGKPNAQLYRNLASNNEWARAAHDLRVGQLAMAEWDLVPFSRDMRPPDKGLVRRIRELLDQPNPGESGLGGFISAIGDDLITLDAGAIEKERYFGGEVAWLWSTDGAHVKVDRFWEGNPKEPRYYFEPEPQVSKPLLNSDLIYSMLFRRTDLPTGRSLMETLRGAIEAELQGSLANSRRVIQGVPEGIMDLGEHARPEQVDAFRSYFENELYSQRASIGFFGGTKNAKFINFGRHNTEMQFMEWQEYCVRKVAAVFQVSVQDLQMLQDVNRANAEVQQANTEDRGGRMVLHRMQDYLTADICWDQGFGGRDNNIAFRFTQVSDRSSHQKAQTGKLSLAGMPWEAINEYRKSVGLPPIGDPADESNPFNLLMANTPLGLVLLDPKSKMPTAYDVAKVEAEMPATPQLGPGPKQKQLDDVLERLGTMTNPTEGDINRLLSELQGD